MTMKRILLLFLLFCGGYVHAQRVGLGPYLLPAGLTEKWTCSSGIIARNWSVLSAFYAKNTGRTDLKALWYVRGHRPKV